MQNELRIGKWRWELCKNWICLVVVGVLTILLLAIIKLNFLTRKKKQKLYPHKNNVFKLNVFCDYYWSLTIKFFLRVVFFYQNIVKNRKHKNCIHIQKHLFIHNLKMFIALTTITRVLIKLCSPCTNLKTQPCSWIWIESTRPAGGPAGWLDRQKTWRRRWRGRTGCRRGWGRWVPGFWTFAKWWPACTFPAWLCGTLQWLIITN